MGFSNGQPGLGGAADGGNETLAETLALGADANSVPITGLTSLDGAGLTLGATTATSLALGRAGITTTFPGTSTVTITDGVMDASGVGTATSLKLSPGSDATPAITFGEADAGISGDTGLVIVGVGGNATVAFTADATIVVNDLQADEEIILGGSDNLFLSNGGSGILRVGSTSLANDGTVEATELAGGATGLTLSSPGAIAIEPVDDLTLGTLTASLVRIGRAGITTTFPGTTAATILNGVLGVASITVTGTVDGRDVSVDGAKLDGIEALADVTDATTVNAAGAVMETDYLAKGSLLVASAASTPVSLAVGADGQVLTADAAEATGVKWATPDGASTWAASLAVGNTSGANNPTITTGQSLLGAAELTLDSTGANAVDLGTGAAAKTVTVGSANTTSSLTLQTGTGAMNLTAGDNMVLSAPGNISIFGDNAVSIGDATTANVSVLSGASVGNFAAISGTGTGTVTLGNGAAGAGTWDSGAGISLDAAGASNFTTSVGALTLDAAAAANLGTVSATSLALGRTAIDTTVRGGLIGGAATGATDDGDFRFGDGTRQALYDASAGLLTLSGQTAGGEALTVTGNVNGAVASLLENTNAGVSARARFKVVSDAGSLTTNTYSAANTQALPAEPAMAVLSTTAGLTNGLKLDAAAGGLKFSTTAVTRWAVANATGDLTSQTTSINLGIGLSNPGVTGTTSGLGVLHFANANTVPTGTLTGGGALLYATGGVLHALDAAGNDSIISGPTVFGQFSDSTNQKPGNTNPTVITFDTDDSNEEITHSRPEDLKPGAGAFMFFLQPQVERTAGGASMDFHAWSRKGRRDGAVTAVSVANPSVITAVDHRIQTGQTVTLSGLTTTPDINAAHVVTVTGVDTFTIPVNVTAVTDGVGDWTRQLDPSDDMANTNIELTLQTANQSDVVPLNVNARLKAEDVIQFIQSVTNSTVGAGLVAQTPSGEPAIPSAILSIHKIGS